MKRIAVIIAVVVGVAATPTFVAASDGSQSRNAGKYDLAGNRNTRLGAVYGPVQTGPASYAYIAK